MRRIASVGGRVRLRTEAPSIRSSACASEKIEDPVELASEKRLEAWTRTLEQIPLQLGDIPDVSPATLKRIGIPCFTLPHLNRALMSLMRSFSYQMSTSSPGYLVW